MHQNRTWGILALLAFVFVPAWAQGSQAQTRITQPVDDSKLTVLKGNTHPLARAEFDRGIAPLDLPMERMLLVLKRSPQQEAALEQLLAEQQDKTSPNFHKWLSPEQFGQQFGPSDSDIQAITTWLETHGFQVTQVAKGRNVIEFSGAAGQVQAAFHTTIHVYEVNGEQHWANASDPEIPTALTPVVEGVATLHNFLKNPLSHSKGTFIRSKTTGEVKPLNPELTLGQTCNPGDLQFPNCYPVAPYDFATIYNVLPLWNAASSIDGSGQSIGIVGRIDINIADVENFRSFVGLPAKNPNIIVNGPDPGVATTQPELNDEGESDLDVQWAGGVARNATIDFVTSKSTTTDGVDLSAEYIVDNNLDPILGYSYGLCEAQMGSADLTFHNSLWQQASGQGITVLIATGDTGSSLCENPQTPDAPGKTGLAVNGVAATPYDVAVGGTDFNDFDKQGIYFSSTSNQTTLESANGYIPETTYNDTCTNAAFIQAGYGSNPEMICNDSSLADYTSPFGGGGGVSTVYTTKPTWQTGIGVPADGARDLPDVSMFGGDGTIVASAYIVCQADSQGASCVSTASGVPFALVGGTSASTQVFGAVMAMVDQKAQGRQGLPNKNLYTLAATPPAASCNSTTQPLTGSNCIFYDVTAGTISMPCVKGTTDCNTTNNADANGTLYEYVNSLPTVPAYNAGTGYDQATGLGSVNVANLVNASGWTVNNGGAPDYAITSAGPTVTVPSQGSTGMLSLMVTSVNNYSGTFNLTPTMCTTLPSEATCTFNTQSASVSPGNPATIQVTINTIAPSMLVPVSRFTAPKMWPAVAVLAFPCLLAMALILLNSSGKQRRWGTAFAFVALALLVPMIGCGGGGGGGGGGCGQGGPCSGGTPTGTTNAVVTLKDTTGVTHSFVFTLTVN